MSHALQAGSKRFLFKLLRLDSAFRMQVLKMAGGTAAAQAAVVAASPLLTRLYSPAEIGLWGQFLAFVGVATVIATLRYEPSIVSAETDEEGRAIALGSCLIALVASAILGLTLFGMIHWNVFGLGVLPTWTAAAGGAAVLASSSTATLRYLLVRRKNFDIISRVLALQGVTRVIVSVVLGATGIGLAGLLVAEIAGRAAGLLRLLKAGGLNTKRDLGLVRPSLRKNWRYPALILPANLIDTVSVWLPIPIIAQVFGLEQAGFFILVRRLMAMPITLVSAGVADVFHAHAAQQAVESPAKLPRLLVGTSRRILMLSTLPAIAAAGISPFIFSSLFGRNWSDAGLLLAAMVPMALATLSVSPVTRTVLVLGRQELMLAYDLLSIAATLTAFYVGSSLGFSFIGCAIIFSVSQTACYAIYWGLLWQAAVTRAKSALTEVPA